MNRLVHSPFAALNKFWDPFNLVETPTTKESISENENGLHINLVLPGVSADELNVECKGDILCIDLKGRSFRSYRLPSKVETSDISAELSRGILTINIPIKKPPTIKIEIKSL